jgi:hypothetical protein
LAATHGLPNYKAKQHQDRPRPIEGMYKPMRTQQLNLGIPAGLGWSNNEECVPQSLVLRNTIDHSKPVIYIYMYRYVYIYVYTYM